VRRIAVSGDKRFPPVLGQYLLMNWGYDGQNDNGRYSISSSASWEGYVNKRMNYNHVYYESKDKMAYLGVGGYYDDALL
jgi:hypothetical protein